MWTRLDSRCSKLIDSLCENVEGPFGPHMKKPQNRRSFFHMPWIRWQVAAAKLENQSSTASAAKCLSGERLCLFQRVSTLSGNLGDILDGLRSCFLVVVGNQDLKIGLLLLHLLQSVDAKLADASSRPIFLQFGNSDHKFLLVAIHG